ncbi:transporter [Priestia aryabhattai]|uniref:transporter n=1 Tax=Priestia aryabhattai TaxID=412384 RepID=UPI002040FEA0|nr:transporter [Priestia aryabhattai]MCM3769265.1 transporter [Priestia aryabhattai]
MYPYQYDPRFQNLFPPGGGQGFPAFPPGGGGQGFPAFPPGGGGQGFPPSPPGGGGQGFPPPPPGGAQPPSSPPPAFTPTPKLGSGGPSLYAVDPGAISGCLYRYTYIWPRNGRPYWFYPTFVGRRSVAGYRWTGSFWVYAGVDVNQIREFQCL